MFDNVSLRTKLIGGYLAVASIIGIGTLVGFLGMKTVGDSMTALYNEDMLGATRVEQTQALVYQINGDVYQYLLNPALGPNLERSIQNEIVATDQQIASYKLIRLDTEKQTQVATFDAAWSTYKDAVRSVLAQIKAGDQAAALQSMTTGAADAARQATTKAANDLITLHLRDAANTQAASAQTAWVVSLLALGGGILGVILALGVAFAISQSITVPLAKLNEMLQKMGKGDLGMRLNLNRADEIGSMARTIDKFAGDLQTMLNGNLLKIAQGDLDIQINFFDSQDEIAVAENKITESLRGLVAEINALTQAAVEGNLSARGNPDKFSGAYRQVVSGVNHTLDAVVGPMKVAAEYVDRISRGDIPPKITDNYFGDFNAVKNNLNACIDAVNLVVIHTRLLSQAAVAGKLTTRADAQRHQGEFRKIIEGINATLDAVIKPLNVAADSLDHFAGGELASEITEDYPGDFAKIKDSVNAVVAMLTMRNADVQMLLQASADGNLHARAEVSKYSGANGNILAGFNQILDRVIAPMTAASQAMAQVAHGDLMIQMNGHYQGDYAMLKDSIVAMVGGLKAMANQSQQGVVSITSASAQILAASTQMASSTREQASAVHQITSTVKEIKASADQVAQQAQSVAEGASAAAQVAQEGKTAMSAAIGGMENIQEKMQAIAENILSLSEQTQQIGEIIDTVSDIAGQSNILALNAAIEAAQAGEAGKGFRVVADEVRHLAEQSRQAAAQIKAILGEIQKATRKAVMVTEEGTREVNTGNGLVIRSAETLSSLARAVEDSAQAAQQIVAGVEQQTIGLDQIVIGMNEINQAAQQSAAGAQQSQQATQDLTRLAEQLKGAVAQYRV